MYRHLVSALAVITLAATAILGGCGSPALDDSPASGDSVNVSASGLPVTLGLTYVPNVQFSPVYVAAEDGIFSNAGLGVNLRHHGSEEGLFSALLSGDEDMTIASADEVLQARAEGADLVSVGAFYHDYPVRIIVPADSNIKTLSDLAGKKIGLPGEFGSNWYGLLAALDQAGLDPNDVQIVPVGYTQASALMAGQVDAIVGFSNSEAVALEQMDFPIRVLDLGDDVPLVGAAIVTTQSWLDANPEAARKMVAAITAGADRVLANPQHALEVSAKWDETLADPQARAGANATLLATLDLFAGPGGKADATQDLAAWQAMAPFLARILNNPDLVDAANGAVTNDFTGGESS